MTPEEFERIETLFGAARDLPAEERDAFLASACAGAPAIRRQVEAMLAAAERDDSAVDPAAITGLPRAREIVEDVLAGSDPMPEQIRDYRIVRVLGRGGMGTVYEAEQASPARRVALKVIRAGVRSRSVLRRFQWEAEVLGRLQHPGIAQIYEAGSFDAGEGGQPFFAMEFIDGPSLGAYVRRYDPDTRARVALFARICDAVHYAHQKGIIHRDLKPDNVLVVAGETLGADEDPPTGAGDDVASVCQPKVLDFGIARATDSDVHTIQTDVGQLVGTVQYMSPEQVLGDSRLLDTRSDLYSLGVMLFELLAGRMPYDLGGGSIPQAVNVIRDETPLRLTSVDRRIGGELSTIVGKCLEKEPERRYASAAGLAADLRRWLSDEPIAARPPSRWYQVRKFARRNRTLVAGTLTTLLALVVGVVVAAVLAVRAGHNEDRARHQAYRANITAATGLVAVDPDEAARLLDEAPEEFRGWEWDYLRAQLERRLAIVNAGAPVVDAVGRADGSIAMCRKDGAVMVADPNGAMTTSFTLPYAVQLAAFTPDAARLATVDDAGALELRDVATGAPIGIVSPVDDPDLLRWDARGERLAIAAANVLHVGREDGTWTAITLEASMPIRRVMDVAFLPGGDDVVVALKSGAHGLVNPLRRYRITDGAMRAELDDIEHPECVAVSPDGRTVAVGHQTRIVRLHDAETLEIVHQFGGHGHGVRDVAFSPDGAVVASCGADDTIRLWDAIHHVPMGVLGETGTALAFTPEGAEVLVTAGDEVRRWAARTAPSMVLRGHGGYVYELAYRPDGALLASSAYFEDELRLWDTTNGALVGALDRHARTKPLAFSEDGTRLLFGAIDDGYAVTMLDPVTGAMTPVPHPGNPRATHGIWRSARRAILYGTVRSDTLTGHEGFRIWRDEYRPAAAIEPGSKVAARSFLEGQLVASARGAPFDLGPRPTPVFLGGLYDGDQSFDGQLAELLIFDGVLSAEDGAAVEAYLGERRETGGGTLPAVGRSVALHLRAEPAYLTLDDGCVQAWRAVGDDDVVLRRRGPHDDAIRYDATALDGRPAVAFGGRKTILAGTLPAHVDLEGATVFMLAAYAPRPAALPRFAYMIGLPTTAHPGFWAAREKWLGAVERIAVSAVVSPDGRMIAVVPEREATSVLLLDGRTHELIDVLGNGYYGVAFHPDGRRLAAGAHDGRIDVWDVHRRELLHSFDAHGTSVYGLDFSPDGRRLASGGNDAAIRLWDTAVWEQVMQLRGHEQYVKAVRFSPDGRQIASSSGDGTVRLWNAERPLDRQRRADAAARRRGAADALVARRLAEEPDLDRLAAQLRSATDLTLEERRAALDALRRRSPLAPARAGAVPTD